MVGFWSLHNLIVQICRQHVLSFLAVLSFVRHRNFLNGQWLLWKGDLFYSKFHSIFRWNRRGNIFSESNLAEKFEVTETRNLRRYALVILWMINFEWFLLTDACSSRSTPKPRPPTPTPRPNITFHMYTCPPDYAEWYCLNGATCFTVKIVDSLLYNCL